MFYPVSLVIIMVKEEIMSRIKQSCHSGHNFPVDGCSPDSLICFMIPVVAGLDKSYALSIIAADLAKTKAAIFWIAA
jgi:hypothetical protein